MDRLGQVLGGFADARDSIRFFAFERRRHSLLSTRAEPFEGGVAFFDDDYPERYVSSFLLVDGGEGTLAGDRLASLADDILGGEGLSHRHVTVLGERGERQASAFRDRGWDVARIVVMALRRPPDRPAALATEECSFDEVRPLLEGSIAGSCHGRLRPRLFRRAARGVGSRPRHSAVRRTDRRHACRAM